MGRDGGATCRLVPPSVASVALMTLLWPCPLLSQIYPSTKGPARVPPHPQPAARSPREHQGLPACRRHRAGCRGPFRSHGTSRGFCVCLPGGGGPPAGRPVAHTSCCRPLTPRGPGQCLTTHFARSVGTKGGGQSPRGPCVFCNNRLALRCPHPPKLPFFPTCIRF